MFSNLCNDVLSTPLGVALSLLALVVASGCRRHETPMVVADGGAITSSASSSTSRVSEPRPQTVDGGACRRDVDCPTGLSCMFEEAGCDKRGICKIPRGPRNCYVAIAMCSCGERRSFYGPGGCAGVAGEPWELYACPCSTDADCRGGQRCVPVGAKPHRPDATRECRDPSER